MTRKLATLSALAFQLLILFQPAANAEWRHTEGPHKGQVTLVRAVGGRLFVALTEVQPADQPPREYFFRSTDDGASWTPVTTASGLPNTGVRDLLERGTNVYAVLYGGVYVSPNNGASWAPVNAGLPNHVHLLAQSATHLFVASQFNGVFASRDDGVTWTSASAGLPLAFPVRALAAGGTHVFAGGYSGFASGALYVSSDNGTTWTRAMSAPASIESLAVANGYLFAWSRAGAFRSPDSGQTWTTINNGLPPPTAQSGDIVATSAGIYVNTAKGVFHSINNGDTWVEIGRGVAHPFLSAFSANATNLYVGTWGGGIFSSQDNGATWVEINEGLLNAGIVYSLAVSNPIAEEPTIFAGTYGGGIYRSTNNGARWVAVNNGLSTVGLLSFHGHALIAVGGKVFAGTQSVFASTDNGASWTLSSNGIPAVDPNRSITDLSALGSRVFAGTRGSGVYRSNDNGASWIPANSGLTGAGGPYITAVVSFASSSSRLSAVTGRYGIGTEVFLWDTRNQSWTRKPFLFQKAQAVAIIGRDLFVGTAGNGILRSTDNGPWTPINNGVSGVSAHALGACGTNLFAATDEGVFLTTNRGENWTDISSGLGNLHVTTFAFSRLQAFAGTIQGGVWRRPLQEVVSSQREDDPCQMFFRPQRLTLLESWTSDRCITAPALCEALVPSNLCERYPQLCEQRILQPRSKLEIEFRHPLDRVIVQLDSFCQYAEVCPRQVRDDYSRGFIITIDDMPDAFPIEIYNSSGTLIHRDLGASKKKRFPLRIDPSMQYFMVVMPTKNTKIHARYELSLSVESLRSETKPAN